MDTPQVGRQEAVKGREAHFRGDNVLDPALVIPLRPVTSLPTLNRYMIKERGEVWTDCMDCCFLL